MALNIKDPETVRLAAEVAALTGDTKTGAIRRSLEERRERLRFSVARRRRSQSLLEFLEREVWPSVPRRVLGKRIAKRELEKLLGYGGSGA